MPHPLLAAPNELGCIAGAAWLPGARAAGGGAERRRLDLARLNSAVPIKLIKPISTLRPV
jgi:hypothetical protein